MNRLFFVAWVLFLSSFCIETIGKTNLRIVTYNIKWDSGKDGANNWVNRKGLLADYINSVNADVICMQEVMKTQQEFLIEALPRYGHVGAGVRDGRMSGESEPIFYDKNKFDLIDYGHFWLSEMPDSIGSIGWGAKHPHVVTWIKLKTSDNKSFYVLNTHFDWDSYPARKKSAQLVVRWINEKVTDEPVIVTGDFNAHIGSDTYKTMINSGIVKDSYQIATKRKGVCYSYHDFGSLPDEKRKILDYIFVSNNIKVKKVEIVREQLKEGCFLSDHNPVIADISLKVICNE